MNTTLSLLLFFVCSIFIGIVLRALLKRSAIMPYSVALLLAGMGLGWCLSFEFSNPYLNEISVAFKLASQLDADLILFIFLPALVFESAFSLEVHLFKRMLSQIALLAIPGLVICTVLSALLVMWALPWQWPMAVALMFGAIVSATDPVAVVALLKEMCSRARLQTLLEGESLLNDGTAIVLFTLFLGLAVNSASSFDLPFVVYEFIRVVSFGVIIGAAAALICLWFINRIFNDSMIEITLTLIMPYIVFYVSEHIFHASGVVSVVTLALIFAGPGRTRFSPEVIEALHHFWHSLSYLFNTLIFVLVGMVIAVRLENAELASWYYLVLVYLGIFVIRAAAVIGMSPILSRVGIGITKEKSMVLVWGGLRGAVSMALALVVATNEQLDIVLRDQVLFLTAGIVVLTIVVNGSTMGKLMSWLGLDKLPQAKLEAFAKVEHKVEAHLDTTQKDLARDPYFSQVNWPLVSRFTERKKLVDKPPSEPDVDTEYLRKLLEAERQFYWNQFAAGLLSQHATTVLVNAIEKALDGKPMVWPRKTIEAAWKPPSSHNFISKIPGTHRLLNNAIYRHQVVCFESAKGLLNAVDFISEQAQQLSHDNVLTEKTLTELAQLKALAEAKLAEFKANDPTLVEKVESYLAARVLLNSERNMLHKLSHQGLISHSDCEKLVKKVEYKMYRMKKKI